MLKSRAPIALLLLAACDEVAPATGDAAVDGAVATAPEGFHARLTSAGTVAVETGRVALPAFDLAVVPAEGPSFTLSSLRPAVTGSRAEGRTPAGLVVALDLTPRAGAVRVAWRLSGAGRVRGVELRAASAPLPPDAHIVTDGSQSWSFAGPLHPPDRVACAPRRTRRARVARRRRLGVRVAPLRPLDRRHLRTLGRRLVSSRRRRALRRRGPHPLVDRRARRVGGARRRQPCAALRVRRRRIAAAARNLAVRADLARLGVQPDPDQPVVRDLPEGEGRAFLALGALSGGAFGYGDDLTALDGSRRALYREAWFTRLRDEASAPAAPLDLAEVVGEAYYTSPLLESLTRGPRTTRVRPPSRWRVPLGAGGSAVVLFNWFDDERTLRIGASELGAAAARELVTGAPLHRDGAGWSVSVPARTVRVVAP